MSLIPLAAHLIRRAARDNESAQDFYDAVLASHQLARLAGADVEDQELAELNSTEWQWYAGWRQEHGGDLNRVVIDHLTETAATRYARFKLDALVLWDGPTNEYAADDGADDGEPPYGATWLTEQARGAQGDRALELMDDALQCATDASWFLLRQLTSGDGRQQVIDSLRQFTEGRDINPELTRRWGLLD